MKKLLLSIVLSMVSLSMLAQTPREIFKIINTNWGEQIPAKSPILTKYGLKVLVSEKIQEECYVDRLFIYGRNVKVKKVKQNSGSYTYYEQTPIAVGANAFAIKIAIATDHGISVYFSDKAKWQAFLNYGKTQGLDACYGEYDSAAKMYYVGLHF